MPLRLAIAWTPFTALIPDIFALNTVSITPLRVLAERLMDMAEAAGVDGQEIQFWTRLAGEEPSWRLLPVVWQRPCPERVPATVRHIAEHLEGFEMILLRHGLHNFWR